MESKALIRPPYEVIRPDLVARPGCPECGAHPPNEILWGLPRGLPPDHTSLGGCLPTTFPLPRWNCVHCGHVWGSWV